MLSDERIRQIAEDIYYSEGTRAEIEHSIRAALAEAAQVPVVGDAVAWTSAEWLKEDGKLHGMTRPHPSFKLPLYRAPTTSITQAELDALRKDAERYRWLRMKGAHSDAVDKVHMFGPKLDRAIDAAIAQEGE
jgi:hypothetical protein